MKKTHSKILSLLAIAAIAAGCAKEKSYEQVYKESVIEKSALSTDPNDPYVYVPSVGETPKDVTASRSFWLGEQKLVTFRYEEDKLIVEELPRETRFSGNRNNFSPVMQFSIDHKDYRCKKDQYKECSNQEEEVDDKPWAQKRFVKVDFASLDLVETNTLPEQLTNAFQGCFGEGQTVIKEVKVEKDALNIHVTKTWKANMECADIQSFDDLRNKAFTVNYFYSFVKLSKLASQDYEAAKYPFEDQNTFGFFTTDVKKLTADNRTTIDSKQTFMNRWNPNRKEMTYYLSEGFYKEGMESVRLATEQAMATINNSLASAGVDLKIKLEDGRGKSIGDARNSFIILVEDPQASGVIGYGPAVTNPRTGEIVKAQTVMYYGTMRKYIQDTYDELLEERAREEQVKAQSEVAANVKVEAGAPISSEESLNLQSHRNLVSRIQTSSPAATNRPVARNANRNVRMSVDMRKEMFNPSRRIELSHWEDQIKNAKNLSESDLAKARMNEMSHHCFYHASMVNWHDAIASEISAEALGIDELKPWNDLSDEEKNKVIDVLMPNVWVSTLVHEFGHNLGLRHNFNGSEDKANYYNATERARLGIKRDITYSSIMDYAHTSLNQLSIMGKYDLAALRFGYNREVELKDGSINKLPKDVTIETLKKNGQDAELKDFMFCTDEHVEVNPGCNRFDDGSGLKAIAQNFVDSYKKNYAKRNFRNRRASFDSYSGDVSYYFGVEFTFESLRRFFELYDRITVQYPWSVDVNWDEEIANAPDEATREVMRSNKEFFVGLKEAAQIAADFYLEVITTPDVHCAVANKQTNRLAGIIPLADIGKGADSCFSDKVKLAPQYAVIGQTGKFMNSQRFEETLPGELNADPSQISVRGIWADKILAIDYLTKRVLGISTFDDVRNNFMDYPAFAGKIQETLAGFLTDGVELEAEFTLADGTTAKIPHVFAIGKTHEIKRSFHSGLNRYLGLNKVMTDYREIMMSTVKKSLSGDADDIESKLGQFYTYDLTREDISKPINMSSVAKSATFKDAQGRFVGRFHATESNTIALELMEMREIRQSLEKFERKDLIQVYTNRASNKVPEQIPEELKVAYEMPVENLLAFLQGTLPEDDHLLRMFLILSK
ncbi:MAG: zinc-dependent metalloprotease [Bacteriovoracaceae bacterium]|nr:zinc-dependent metalloprotease [Bacteriovoracaceae bacterium]